VLRHSRLLRTLALAAALATAACRRGAGPAPERFLPADADLALVVPELRRAAAELTTLQAVASAFPGAELAPARRKALAAQLGFDPLVPDELARIGLDPARGLAMGQRRGTAMLIVPVRDAGALEATVAGIARERLGAPERSETASGDVRVIAFGAPGVKVPRLLVGFHAGARVAALAPGTHAGADDVRAWLGLEPAKSLAEAPRWRDARAALGDRYALLLFGALDRGPGRRPIAGAGLSAEPGAVRLGLAYPLGDGDALHARGASGDAKVALHALAPDAPLALRWDGDPAALGRLVLARMAEADRRWLADRGFDPQRDLFDLLAPGVAASVSLSPRLDLSDLSDVALRADPLRVVRFELAAEVTDAAAAGRALARLPALFAALQEPVGKPRPATVEPDGRAGRIPLASGELAWTLEGKRLLLAGGPPGALDALATRAAKGSGWVAPTKLSAEAMDGGLGGAVLAPPRLGAEVRALPDDAFGTGPIGFVIRGTVERYLEPFDAIQAVSARAELAEGAVRVEVRAEVSPQARGGKR
jgi:hypothetical protein